MEGKGNQQKPNASKARIYQIPGESFVVIDGVPDITSTDSTTPAPIPSRIAEENKGPLGFAEWFIGREVRKSFMGKYYSGSVTEFDRENGWFRVLYEDGDSEDLDWPELEEVLLPLDVTIPLKTLAQGVLNKSFGKNVEKKVGKNVAHSSKTKKRTTKGK